MLRVFYYASYDTNCRVLAGSLYFSYAEERWGSSVV